MRYFQTIFWERKCHFHKVLFEVLFARPRGLDSQLCYSLEFLRSSAPGSHPEVVVIGMGVGLEEILLKLPRWLRCAAREDTIAQESHSLLPRAVKGQSLGQI